MPIPNMVSSHLHPTSHSNNITKCIKIEAVARKGIVATLEVWVRDEMAVYGQ